MRGLPIDPQSMPERRNRCLSQPPAHGSRTSIRLSTSDAPTPPLPPGLAGWRQVLLVIAIVAVSAAPGCCFCCPHLQPPHRRAPHLAAPRRRRPHPHPRRRQHRQVGPEPPRHRLRRPAARVPRQPVTGPPSARSSPTTWPTPSNPAAPSPCLDQQPTGDWRVRWTGGNTLPPFIKRRATSTPTAAQTPSSS